MDDRGAARGADPRRAPGTGGTGAGDAVGLDRLEAVMLRINGAVTRGDLASLAGLTRDLEAALPGTGARSQAATAARILALAHRNAACLEAAQRGLRAARRRVSEIGAARAGLVTYDGSGATQRLGRPAGTLAHRV